MNVQTALKNVVGALAILIIGIMSVGGQTAKPAETPKTPASATPAPTVLPRAALKGRVLTEDGEPVRGTSVFATPVGRGMNNRQGPMNNLFQATTDEEGNFSLEGLTPAAYQVLSSAPGYVTIPADDENSANLHYPGESVTLTLAKGGVITGKVTSANGDPLTGITINVERVGNNAGAADNLQLPNGFARQWRTDDRGVYRVYGLVPGNYLVQAGGRNSNAGNFGPPGFNQQNNDTVPTYYPSAVRDGAVPVNVFAGMEAAGIDIRYRGERGHAVSGKITLAKTAGSVATETGFGMTQIFLTVAGSDAVIATTRQMNGGGPGGFGPPGGGRRMDAAGDGYAFYGIADGEYDVYARRNSPDGDWQSAPKRLSVHGADISGVELVLNPLASISGRLVMEKRAGNAATACPTARPLYLTETLVKMLRDETKPVTVGQTDSRLVAADQAGNFTLRGLSVGKYRVDAEMAAPNWYIRSLQFEKTNAASTTANKTASTNVAVANVARDGITLKQGEKQSGLVVTLTEGAAALRGKLVSTSKQLILLIPAEKESADDLLRYAQTVTNKDGIYQFSQMAPGKYWLLKQGYTENQKPTFWDTVKRAALRRTAETTGMAVELSACQTTVASALN